MQVIDPATGRPVQAAPVAQPPDPALVQQVPVTTPVRSDASFGERIMDAMRDTTAALFAIVPRLLAFFLILLIGWLVASLVARGVHALLRAVRFDDMAHRTGVGDAVSRMHSRATPSGVVAGTAKWLVRIVVLLVAFGALGLPAVSAVLQRFLLWLPNLVVAIAVLVLAGLAARGIGNLVRGLADEAGFTNPDTLATVARVTVWAFAAVVALNQIGIATTLINTLFMGVVGAVSLASGLAFGLGGREKAAELLERWSEAGGDAKDRVADAAQSRRTRQARQE